MVYRIYTEKKDGFRAKATALQSEARSLLGIERLRGVRIINRYDVEGISEELFDECRWKVFAEKQLDNTSFTLHGLIGSPVDDNGYVFDRDGEDDGRMKAFVFAAGTAPGKTDRRAESAAQCIQMTTGENPLVKCAVVYVLEGELMPADIDAVKQLVINGSSAAELSLDMPDTLAEEAAAAEEKAEKVLNGFREMTESEMRGCVSAMGLSMDEADLALCVNYFENEEHRDPTETELRTIDMYRSESIRHTTFNTVIDSVTFEDPVLEKAYMDYLAVRRDLGRDKPVTLDDIATIAVRHFRREGVLEKVDGFGCGSACSVMINAEVDGENEPWLLFFGNEMCGAGIESDPSGTAAECFTGCVSELLSERAYPYTFMRLTGAADPLQPVTDTLSGKLPQRKLAAISARGASETASLAGIPAGMVDETYHPGFASGRMETYAALAAAPSVNIRREDPEPDDAVMLVCGKDGGGLYRMQRFFRDSVASRMMKRCSTVGEGGLAAAATGLAGGLEIDLQACPDEWTGARMACVIAPENEKLFTLVAVNEGLSCVRAASVTDAARLVLRRGEDKVVDISMDFLVSGGSEKHTDIVPEKAGRWQASALYGRERSFTAGMHTIASDLNVCSKRGLGERFDSTAGAGTVLMPFGGDNQITPAQAMVNKLPLEKGSTEDCTMMAWGYNPLISAASPYHGAYLSVVESVSKLIATGASFKDIYLMFRGYFADPGKDEAKWGRPLAAVLGAFEAQAALGICAAGGSDSIGKASGEGPELPPALVTFAVTTGKAGDAVSPEFKKAGHRVVLLRPYADEDESGAGSGLPDPDSLLKVWEKAADMLASGVAAAAYTPGIGGIAEAVMKMAYGNGIGFSFEEMELEELFRYAYGSIVLEVEDSFELAARHMEIELLGHTTEDQHISFGDEKVSLAELLTLYEGRLESVYHTLKAGGSGSASNIEYRARSWHTPLYKRSVPKVLIPVFPGTNCEHDVARAVREAGAAPEIMLIKNGSEEQIKRSVEAFAGSLSGSQIVMLPGGFSAFGEPDGSAKLTAAFFRKPEIAEGIASLLDKKDGLMCGICDGFQALIKLGLVPYGKITETEADSPTLTFNTIGRTQSRIARVRIASNKSPWLRYNKVGDVYLVPVSCGEGRFVAPDSEIQRLIGMGQIATQYADLEGGATAAIRFNPTGSMMAVEGLTSPDGRVIGRMGHAERNAAGLYGNVPGSYIYDMFVNAVKYYK